MRSSAGRTLIACAPLLFLIACERGTTAVRTAGSLSFEKRAGPFTAGKPSDTLRVTVLDELGVPMPNASVTWTADDGGTTDPGQSTTNAKGLAWTRWTPGPHTGPQTLHARSGQAAAELRATVYENVPVRMVTTLPDTLRFSSANQQTHVRATTYDQHGNPWDESLVTFVWRGPPGLLSINLSTIGVGSTEGSGWLMINSNHYPGISDSAFIIFERIPARIASFGVTQKSLTAGESASVFSAAMFDSLGGGMSGTTRLDLAGATFTSSDSTVASIDPDGLVHARNPGTVVLRATAGAVSAQAPLTVYRRFELGTMQPIVDAGTSAFHTAWAFGPDGTRIDAASRFGGFPQPNDFGFFVESKSSAGTSRWIKRYGNETDVRVAVGRDGTVYAYRAATQQLDVYGPDGTVRLTRPSTCGASAPAKNASFGAVTDFGRSILTSSNCVASITADGTSSWTVAMTTRPATLSIPGSVYAIERLRATRIDEITGYVTWSTTLPWTVTLAIADANGTLYLAGGRRLLVLNGDASTRWEGTLSDSAQQIFRDARGGIVVLSADGLQEWDARTGTLRWSATIPETGPNQGALAADDGRVYVTRGEYVYVIDGGSGTLLGRSAKYAAGVPSLINGTMFVTSRSGGFLLRVPFGPADGWSQVGGNAGMTNSVP